ncbi:MAG: hypothetical protein ABJ056_11505 [Halioglobus sp.]
MMLYSCSNNVWTRALGYASGIPMVVLAQNRDAKITAWAIAALIAALMLEIRPAYGCSNLG